jgi:undecaprenyl-phosphate 4-deoxy-4-formamido-L-arabinose transferase
MPTSSKLSGIRVDDAQLRFPTAIDDWPKGISVVIPVYNSQDSLPVVIERLKAVLSSCAAEFEVVLVDDSSRDGSWEVIRQLVQQHPWVHGIHLMRNFGQHNALLCGIRAAQYEITATLDDDLQNPPEEIPKMLRVLLHGFDVVYGQPERQQHGVLRDAASTLTKIALQSAMGAETARCVSAYRVFRTRIRDAFVNYKGPYVSIDVLLTWGTTRFTAVKVRHDARTIGSSGYTLGKLIRHAMNMMTGFSTFPLQVASIIGFVFTFFGLGVLTYVLTRYLMYGSTVAGFPFLASVIAIFSGAQLFALGIIGEYLARMHFRTMDRPPYAVREIATSDTAAAQKQDLSCV